MSFNNDVIKKEVFKKIAETGGKILNSCSDFYAITEVMVDMINFDLSELDLYNEVPETNLTYEYYGGGEVEYSIEGGPFAIDWVTIPAFIEHVNSVYAEMMEN